MKGKMLFELPVNDSRNFFARATGRSPIRAIVGTADTLTEDDVGGTVMSNATGMTSVTVPPNTGQFNQGDTILLSRYNTGGLTVVAGAGVTIRTASGAPLTISAQYGDAALQNLDGANEWKLAGMLG